MWGLGLKRQQGLEDDSPHWSPECLHAMGLHSLLWSTPAGGIARATGAQGAIQSCAQSAPVQQYRPPCSPLQSQGRHYMWWAAAAQHPGLAHGCSCAFQRSSGCSLSIAALSKWRRNMGCNRISRADCKAWSSSQSELAGCEGQAAQASTGIPHEMPVLLWLMPSRAPGAWPPEPGLERCFGPGAALTHSRQHDVPCRLSSLYFHYFFLPSQLLLGRDVTEAVYKE